MNKAMYIFCGLLFVFGSAVAQQREIRGIVMSSVDNGPLLGVVVRALGTPDGKNIVVTTQSDGRYVYRFPQM